MFRNCVAVFRGQLIDGRVLPIARGGSCLAGNAIGDFSCSAGATEQNKPDYSTAARGAKSKKTCPECLPGSGVLSPGVPGFTTAVPSALSAC